MAAMINQIRTDRLCLRAWRSCDIDVFAELHTDPIVMHDLGGPISRELSERKLQDYADAHRQFGYSRWCVENHAGRFLGYVGVFPRQDDHPIGEHDELGWRLARDAWGHGFATEAAKAALSDAFERRSMSEILSYTMPDNKRSQSVMSRLSLRREPSRDFIWNSDGVVKPSVMVWVASNPDLR